MAQNAIAVMKARKAEFGQSRYLDSRKTRLPEISLSAFANAIRRSAYTNGMRVWHGDILPLFRIGAAERDQIRTTETGAALGARNAY